MTKNIKDMSMMELENHLFEIAETTSHQYIAEQFEAIIYAIIRFYSVTDGYYPEDAIRSFKQFLTTGTLEF